jgi:hypothetical protein
MNKAKLKSYAPQARKDFIAAVTARTSFRVSAIFLCKGDMFSPSKKAINYEFRT